MTAQVKWYDQYNRLWFRNFSTVDSARTFYKTLIAGKDVLEGKPIYARFTATSENGQFVLGEFRPV